MSHGQVATSTNTFLRPVAPTFPRNCPIFRKRQFPGIFEEEEPAKPISPNVAFASKKSGTFAEACTSRCAGHESDAYVSVVETSPSDMCAAKIKTRNPFLSKISKPKNATP
eukprot:gnl/TRDRNA2_/TRDRNA2_165128_c0_seq1.p1 gnl/TRDRNA2_/TRDRNA2_165128_c0~~gnl/TRDRNA2_/TRDRNA2_165128_c0_seq1.p1  ORF type:complete len:126 (+),score=12.48 gnl/TRDRNA2_/TRDRNA2_165128_c0_seq1:46-378(+)